MKKIDKKNEQNRKYYFKWLNNFTVDRKWEEILKHISIIATYDNFPWSRSSAAHIQHLYAIPVGFLLTYCIRFYNYASSSNSIRELIVFLVYVNALYKIQSFSILSQNFRISLRNLRWCLSTGCFVATFIFIAPYIHKLFPMLFAICSTKYSIVLFLNRTICTTRYNFLHVK